MENVTLRQELQQRIHFECRDVRDDKRMRFKPNETAMKRMVRFRSLGCYPLSAAVASEAADMDALLAEMKLTRDSERAGRLIDQEQEASMERRKREGYF